MFDRDIATTLIRHLRDNQEVQSRRLEFKKLTSSNIYRSTRLRNLTPIFWCNPNTIAVREKIYISDAIAITRSFFG